MVSMFVILKCELVERGIHDRGIHDHTLNLPGFKKSGHPTPLGNFNLTVQILNLPSQLMCQILLVDYFRKRVSFDGVLVGTGNTPSAPSLT